MSRRTDHKPKSIKDDFRRLELVFTRAFEDGGELWTPDDRRWILKNLDPVVQKFRSRMLELGVTPSSNGRSNGKNGGARQNGRAAQVPARKSA